MKPTVRPSRLVLLGDPVSQSLSPVFQNAALRAAALPMRYEVLHTPAASLPATIEVLRRERAAGNVTVPHKEFFSAHCNLLTDIAARVGAVNTFWFVDEQLVGDNTDVDGVARAIEAVAGGTCGGARCLVLGAGGSAAAVIAALMREQVSAMTIAARTPQRAFTINARLNAGATVIAQLPATLDEFDIVINTTPVGMHDDLVPIDVHLLRDDAIVLDIVYRAGGTRLVRNARARGLRAEDGLRMLMEQGARSFEQWFGRPPDRDVMWHALARYRT